MCLQALIADSPTCSEAVTSLLPSSRASATSQAAVKMTGFRRSEPSVVIDILGNDLCRTIARETGLSTPAAITGTMQTKLMSIQTVCTKFVEFILVRGMISGHCAFKIRSSAARLECWIFQTNHRGSRNHVVLRNLWATFQKLLAASLLLRCRKCRHMRLVGSCLPQLVSYLFWGSPWSQHQRRSTTSQESSRHVHRSTTNSAETHPRHRLGSYLLLVWVSHGIHRQCSASES